MTISKPTQSIFPTTFSPKASAPLVAVLPGRPSTAVHALASPASLWAGASRPTLPPPPSSSLVRPPGLPTREHAAGAAEADGLNGLLAELVHANSHKQVEQERLVHALEGLRRGKEEDRVASKGTLGAIGRSEELDVDLARGCDTLTIEACPTLLGRDLFLSLKRACEHAKALMQQVRWPTTVSNRMACGISALCWGGARPQDDTALGTFQR